MTSRMTTLTPRRKKALITVLFIKLALGAFLLASLPAKASQHTSRLSHARELMGSYYSRSVVRQAESLDDLSDHITEWTSDAMKGRHHRHARAVASAILAESRVHGFDPIFLMAVIESESSFNPLARGTSGEVGLMQLMPETARWIAKREGWNLKITSKCLRDPVINIKIGAAYLAYLRKQFDSHGRLYLSAYNMGATNVNRALARQVWPKEYSARVMTKYIEYYRELRKERG